MERPEEALLEARGLVRRYRKPGTTIREAAVHGVSLAVYRGETFGVVGPSGAGKSTLLRLLLALERPDEGSVRFAGHDLNRISPRRLRQLRRRFQPVFQESAQSLNPRLTVTAVIMEPMLAHGIGDQTSRRREVERMLDHVGLPRSVATRQPPDLSGGQRQRVALARALSCKPDLLLLDEPVASLDVRTKWRVLSHLAHLRHELNVTMILVSHDTDVVRLMCSRTAVIESGKIRPEPSLSD